MPRGRTRPDHGAMPEDLDERLRRLRSSDDAGALIDLGCALADVGRHEDAEWCFRRATGGTAPPPPTRSRWPAVTPPPGAASARSSRSGGSWTPPSTPTAAPPT